MGIVHYGRGYINNSPCRKTVSRLRTAKVLTRQNIQFLKSLGFRVNPGGK